MDRPRSIVHSDDSPERARQLELARFEAEGARADAEGERERLARILEQAPFAVAVLMGPDHVLTSANAWQRRLIGPRPWLGLSGPKSFPEPEMNGVHAAVDHVYTTGETRVLREQPIGWDRGSGQVLTGFFDMMYQPIRDAEGRVEGVLTFAIDVSQSVADRQAEARARAEAEAARLELEQAHAQLEQRIASRTAELARTNAALAAEIEVRVIAEATRNQLQRRLATAREDEQRRTARDLHDQVGQTLSALMLAVKAACDVAPLPAAARVRLDDALRLAEDLARDVHDLATRLRPTLLDDLGLHSALRQLLTDWSRRYGPKVDLQAAGLARERLPADLETVLYWVVQEAMTNVARHARAQHVSVVIERHEGHAIAVVEDDGDGFDPSASSAGRLGLVGMRERVMLAAGSLEVESEPGRGTTVIARLPLEGRRCQV